MLAVLMLLSEPAVNLNQKYLLMGSGQQHHLVQVLALVLLVLNLVMLVLLRVVLKLLLFGHCLFDVVNT